MLMDQRTTYRRLRAPGEHGQVLIDPAPSAVASAVAGNVEARDEFQYDLQGRDLRELSTSARSELIETALNHTRAYRDVTVASDNGAPLFLAGHQPKLFHPGVWFKNVALTQLAAEHGGIAVNLLIDNDVCRTATARVPGGTPAAPSVETVAFDEAAPEQPYEERAVLDPATFESFGRRAAEVIRPLVPDTMLANYWPRAVERQRATGNLGQALAQARHQLEGDAGLQSLEIAESAVCQTNAFHWFATHLIAQLPRFWEIYNSSIREVRRENHIRSHAHPVPDLSEVDGWLEAPFWMWSEADPQRRALFVRPQGDRIVLSDRHQTEVSLDLTPDGDGAVAVDQLAELPNRGIKIRPRALITTMFARLLLSDLFLHGIGGAKYDELTDRLIRRFFQLQPPEFSVVSATLHLPIDRPPIDLDDPRRIDRRLRELTWHPERFVDTSTDRGEQSAAGSSKSLTSLVEQKRLWIGTPKTPENAHTRHLEIASANVALQPWLTEQRRDLLSEREEAAAAWRAEAILASREYAFCLHERETLSHLILEMRRRSA